MKWTKMKKQGVGIIGTASLAQQGQLLNESDRANLQYFSVSTAVLIGKYSSTDKEVLLLYL